MPRPTNNLGMVLISLGDTRRRVKVHRPPRLRACRVRVLDTLG